MVYVTVIKLFLLVFSKFSMYSYIPAAYHSLAGKSQVQEILACPVSEGILQCLSIYDESEVVLLVQSISQHAAVMAECLPGTLHTNMYRIIKDIDKHFIQNDIITVV